MDSIKVKNAFVAVFDKAVLDTLLPILLNQKVKVIGTRGTVGYLKSKGVDALSVVEGFDFDGRVKSLDKKNFAAVLADKSKPKHLKELKTLKVLPVDAVVVDLYKPDPKNFPETMDIGGQALIRAAIKNFENVAVAYDKNTIDKLAAELAEQGGVTTYSFRKEAAKRAAKYISERAKLEGEYFSRI